MPRLPESEIERVKCEIDLVSVVEGYGVGLKRRGANWIGHCPFHDDKTPSFVVTPNKNGHKGGLWRCMGACDVGGSVIDFVMRREGVGFREAVDRLLPQLGPLSVQSAPAVPTVETGVATQGVLEWARDQYQGRLGESEAARQYLESRGLWNAELLTHFGVGFCDRSLGLGLASKQSKVGAAARSALQAVGVLRASGHEHLRGCVTVPLYDLAGEVVQLYGRRVGQRSEQDHLYLSGGLRGTVNLAGLVSTSPLVVCESVFDAMSLWVSGYRNVSCCLGVNHWPEELTSRLRELGVREVVCGFDGDAAGERGYMAMRQSLEALGVSVSRLRLGAQEDANSVLCAEGSVGLLSRLPERRRAAAATVTQEATIGAPIGSVPSGTLVKVGEEYEYCTQLCRYRVRGLERNAQRDTLRVVLFLERVEVGSTFVDSVDLYVARQRAAWCESAAGELGLGLEVVKRDVGAVLRLLEQQRAQPEHPQSVATMSEAEREEALQFLQSPDLLERIGADLARMGLVGEDSNKLTAYLAATSRLLERPLAVVVQSSSAAGKSSLMDAVLKLMPPESVNKYSALTGQALYYWESANLSHSILAVVEEAGAERASYAMKLLQSEGELTIASTSKDPKTGQLVTRPYHVKGPVMLFLTTTAIDLDEELLNRCLVLSVNESREQTRAIHAVQRRAQTLEGRLQSVERERVVRVHCNAQRLLRPLWVVNPLAEQIGFVDHSPRTRRDHAKFLALIQSLALMQQYQREVHRVEIGGTSYEYIEATEQDIALAQSLFEDVLRQSLDELPPPTRRVYAAIEAMVTEGEILSFSRRQLREHLAGSEATLKRHLARLVELEYLRVVRGDNGLYLYELETQWLSVPKDRLTGEGHRLTAGSAVAQG